MTAFRRDHGHRCRIGSLAKGDFYTFGKELACQLGLARKAVYHPWLTRSEAAVQLHQPAVSPHTVDYQWFAYTFGQRCLTQENFLLHSRLAAAQGIEPRFANGGNARVGGKFFEFFPGAGRDFICRMPGVYTNRVPCPAIVSSQQFVRGD